MAVVFALIAFLGWGIGDVFGGIVSRKIGGYSATFWLDLIGVLLMSFYAPFVFDQLKLLTLPMGLLIIVLVIIGAVPTIAFFEGLKVGNASLVGTIASAFAAFTVILSVIFLGDRLTTAQSFSIVIIFSGLIISSIDIKKLKLKQLFTDRGVPYALVSLFLWGVYFTFIKIPVKQIGWFWPAYFSFWPFLLIYLYMRLKRLKVEPLKGGTIRFSILNTVLSVSALFSFNLAISLGQTAIVAPIAGSYPVLFVLIAYFVFKDRLNRQQLLGIITTLVGIVLLSSIAS